MAHSYVRYLGDMSGGQFIDARVKRSYGLPKFEGHEFYHFHQDGKVVDPDESMGDTKRRLGVIKDWFRRGMDEGVGEDEELKRESAHPNFAKEAPGCIAIPSFVPLATDSFRYPDAKLHTEYLVKEANLAFALNTHLFALINPPSSVAIPSSSNDTAVDVVNRPLDPSQPHKRYYELNQNGKPKEVATKQTWRELIERFALAALALFIGQIIARFGVPWARKQLDALGGP